MQPHLRIGALAFALVAILMMVPPFNGTERIGYILDRRPEQRILFVGNGLTALNDMPDMVRRIADSAGYPFKLRMELQTPGNARLIDHWSDLGVREALSRPWDHVVIQAQSTEQIDVQNWGKWLEPAKNIIEAAQASDPAMFVTWRYTDQCDDERKWSAAENDAMHTAIQDQHSWLARATGVDLVNVGLVWQDIASRDLDFSLYTNCNLPSIHGSYLAALVFFGSLLEGDVALAAYRPAAVTPQQAELLRTAVADALDKGQLNAEASGQSQPIATHRPSGVPALCLFDLLVSLRQVHSTCEVDHTNLDTVLDSSIPRIGEHLVAMGEMTRSQLDQRLANPVVLGNDADNAKMCESTIAMRDQMPLQEVTEITEQILATPAGQFSRDCI